jgi:hypothetical protein
MNNKMIFTGDAIDAAARLPVPTVIEAAARRAITSTFGAGFRLKSFDDRTVSVSVQFTPRGCDSFVAYLVAADLWEVDAIPVPRTPRTVRLADRAVALVNSMGWSFDAVERSARMAAFSIGGERRVAGFSIPIECIDFTAALTRDGTIEVDLVDLTVLPN